MIVPISQRREKKCKGTKVIAPGGMVENGKARIRIACRLSRCSYDYVAA